MTYDVTFCPGYGCISSRGGGQNIFLTWRQTGWLQQTFCDAHILTGFCLWTQDLQDSYTRLPGFNNFLCEGERWCELKFGVIMGVGPEGQGQGSYVSAQESILMTVQWESRSQSSKHLGPIFPIFRLLTGSKVKNEADDLLVQDVKLAKRMYLTAQSGTCWPDTQRVAWRLMTRQHSVHASPYCIQFFNH